MYNTKIVCTYNAPEVFESSDTISDEDKQFIRDTIYRQELLDILGMSEFNEDEMNKAIHELYVKIESCKELKECMTKLSGRFLSEDLELGLMLMFAYDYMYLTHICICEYLENPPLENPPLEKVEPNTSEVGRDFVDPNTSEVGRDFVEPNRDFVEPNSQNIKALIKLINS